MPESSRHAADPTSAAAAHLPPNPPAVLCVDDDECIVSTLVHIMRSMGLQAEGASDGHIALNLAAANLERFDVVVTDHRMPIMGGLELVRRLLELGYRGGIVVHCSPLCPSDQSAYQALGIDHFIPKPSDLVAIVEIVKASARCRN